METEAKKGSAELEASRMAAVLNASYPKGWRFRTLYARSGPRYRAQARVERFDGVCGQVLARVSLVEG